MQMQVSVSSINSSDGKVQHAYLFIECNLLHEGASHLSQVGCTGAKGGGPSQGQVVQETISAAMAFRSETATGKSSLNMQIALQPLYCLLGTA